MKKPFKLLRELSQEVAETISASLGDKFYVFSEGCEFEQYAWVIRQAGEYDSDISFKLVISRDDLEQYFRELP